MSEDKKKKKDEGGEPAPKKEKVEAAAGDKVPKEKKGEGRRGQKREAYNTDAPAGDGPARSGPPRLKVRYDAEIAPQLMKDFNFKSKMQVPRLVKITVNIGLGEAISNPKLMDTAVESAFAGGVATPPANAKPGFGPEPSGVAEP